MENNTTSIRPSTCGKETAADHWTNYFTRTQWLLYAIFIVGGLLLRWTLLDMRPYHHDESLHGMYGRYFYDWPNSNYYKYDPMLHGPMLYNCMRFIYAMFGDSLWAARTPVCIMGSIFLFMPFLFRRFFQRTTVLVLTSFVAFSPTLIYWSRFLREDYWVVSGMLLMLYGFLLAPPSLKAFWVFFGLAIQWCTKENVFVSLVVFLGYIIFEAVFRLVVLNESDSVAKRIFRYVADRPWHVCWGFTFSFLVYCWFFSAGFRFPEGIIDGLGKKGFDYWMEHHNKERIEGPFNFHLYVLGWYELPFLIAYLTHLAIFYKRTRRELQFAGGLAFVTLVLCLNLTDFTQIKTIPMWKFFKLKDWFDMVGLFFVLFHAPIVTIHHLLKREYVLGGCAYFFTATLFVYSYLGEKVPWLSLYPLIFGLPYLALFFQDYFTNHPVDFKHFSVRRALFWLGTVFMAFGLFFIAEEHDALGALYNGEALNLDSVVVQNAPFLVMGVILVACAFLDYIGEYLGTFNAAATLFAIITLYNLRGAIQTNYLYAGKETEYLSQVHTTYEVADAAQRIEGEILFERNMYRPKVLVTGEATWPLTWYFRHLPNEYRFSATPSEMSQYTYIFQDEKNDTNNATVPPGYTLRKMNLRGWWVPDFSQMTLKKFLRYSINKYPWGPSGFTYTTLLVAKDVERFR